MGFLFFTLPSDRKKEKERLSRYNQGESSAASSSDSQSSVKTPGRVTVLIAVESSEFAAALSRALGARNFSCVVAEDGRKASSMFFERRPDVAVLSFGITGREDGIEAAKEILLARSKTEVVILTDSNSKVTNEVEQCGVELFIDKHTNFLRIINSICAVSNLKKSTCNLVAR